MREVQVHLIQSLTQPAMTAPFSTANARPDAIKVSVTLWRGPQENRIGECGLPLEIGRQSRQELDSDLCQIQDHGNQFRIAIAEITVLGLPRHALNIQADEQGGLVCVNLHSRSTFQIAGMPHPVMPEERVKVANEFTVLLPENLTIHVAVVSDGSGSSTSDGTSSPMVSPFRTIAKESLAADADLGDFTMPVNPGASFIRTFGEDSSPHRGQAAVDLVRQALAVVKKSAGSDEFFGTAVESVAKMVELDRAYVLLRDGIQNQWRVRSHYIEQDPLSKPKANFGQETEGPQTPQTGDDAPVGDTPLPSGSRLLLKQILKERKTLIYEPESYQHTIGSSIMMLDRAVAAPIFDDQGEIIGALYGDRTFGSHHADTPIGDLEATLLEVMAGAVSAGIVRQRHEAIQNSMTQFFSPAVTQRLVQNEDLLTGRDAEVSVLFCDIRGFSSISERVGPEKTIQWINDVFTQLSLCVVRTDGVLVNYIGDELVAMWGAPAEQPDHARRACDAACQMLQQIEPLRKRWSSITPEKFGIGIGIHTGTARVGNTGSKVKFQYGPLGNTVNLASRVQNITKKFGVTAIVTLATQEALHAHSNTENSETENGTPSTCTEKLQTRRLATVRPVGMSENVDLYELQTGDDPNWRSLADRYESALQLYHESDLTGAARVLASLVHEHPDDSPSVVLLGRVVDAITNHIESVDPVMAFTTK
ncbi:Adenylate and Guanylate cyclase catalytic domain-containing protein [Neorhodopirellula lusitana]|uniref:Adenylate and Guanylate cyclase catalytic domain-containing protein n=2 Tax=Neorhodopirellula lusitana TaxID=445327 RepID=A0ABY1PNT8_9BACT|nr:Adenylate and Guanylate cyclase catalytic domain-containing protein [Neorhodopirellula lusitana]